eukprot:6097909-Pyramimonas_sp.AAC.1
MLRCSSTRDPRRRRSGPRPGGRWADQRGAPRRVHGATAALGGTPTRPRTCPGAVQPDGGDGDGEDARALRLSA